MYEIVGYTPKEVFNYYVVISLAAIIIYPILMVIMRSVTKWK